MSRRCAMLFWAFLLLSAARVVAEEWQPIARVLPPIGIAISPEDRIRLTDGLEKLDCRLKNLRAKDSESSGAPLLADVEILHKAVLLAVENSEFYRLQDVAMADELTATALKRLDELEAGHPSWTTARGLVVRGYRSEVDDSVQPYGLVIPEQLDTSRPVPLYVWLHGRNDHLTDLAFIHERQRQPGQVKPEGAIVLHPFGRSCLGWKSTAEIDVLEAVEAVKRQYPIDPDRIVLMGFSMGGAGAWHLGAHYAERWAAVHAGAGFVDVARYNRLAAADYPAWYEQRLWGWYDVPDYVRNLFNVPVVAYSGEVDKQKDAADFMAEAFQQHGQTLTHLIGRGMGHKYDPAMWQQVMERMEAAVAQGRNRDLPKISFQTRTLRYPRLHWVEALALGEHWQDARIDARFVAADTLQVTTRNIRALRLAPPNRVASLSIDGQAVSPIEPPMRFEFRDGQWSAMQADDQALRKSPGLQGPIDDAFMAPFMVVLPSGKSPFPDVQRWVDFELNHFQERWRSVYRGQLRMKRDAEVTADDVARFHLVAWGDAKSNQLIGRLVDKLPIRWTPELLEIGPTKVDASRHVPLLIYPNPLNRARYVVLNSGPTHREAHDRTNSLQNPKLPDWAILDVAVPPDATRPGGIVAADFFDEQWQAHH